MQPKKYIEDLESSARRRKLSGLAGNAVILLFSLLFFGPFIHETAHIAVLRLIECQYGFDYGFQVLRGVYGTVTPYCQPGKSGLLLFYSAGYLATILIGGFLSAVSMEADSERLSLGFGSLGVGILMSVLLSVGVAGDISSIIAVLDLSSSYGTIAIIFIVIGIFITTLQVLEHIFKLEREE